MDTVSEVLRVGSPRPKLCDGWLSANPDPHPGRSIGRSTVSAGGQNNAQLSDLAETDPGRDRAMWRGGVHRPCGAHPGAMSVAWRPIGQERRNVRQQKTLAVGTGARRSLPARSRSACLADDLHMGPAECPMHQGASTSSQGRGEFLAAVCAGYSPASPTMRRHGESARTIAGWRPLRPVKRMPAASVARRCPERRRRSSRSPRHCRFFMPSGGGRDLGVDRPRCRLPLGRVVPRRPATTTVLNPRVAGRVRLDCLV